MIMRYILFIAAWTGLGVVMVTGGWDLRHWRYWAILACTATIHFVG